MAVWTCADCTADYAVGLPQCPQCGSVVRIDDRPLPDEEENVAKVTVHGGASDAHADETRAGEDVSAGTSSSTSSAKEPTSPKPSETPDRSRARTTGNRSKKARTGSSSAAGTAGDRETGTSAADD